MTTRPKEENTGKPGAGKGGSPREARLKAALKANLARRKTQARKRAEGTDGPQAAEPEEN
jgi:hypothetical protein